MRIANPIYDVVFKYLLDDEKVARMLLGALLGREILELRFRPTEVRQEFRKEMGPSLLVLRMDFAATLLLEDGSRALVLIEIQKALNTLDIMRFRRYLGTQYAGPENAWTDVAGRRQALPLITIYFLGEGLPGIDAPVLRVHRHYVDAATSEVLPLSDPFVEALTHDAIIVQVDRLKNRRRTELECLLTIFDQGQAAQSDPHLLEILEESFPERYREVLRRLMRATVEADVRETMNLEDEILTFLQSKDRIIADHAKVIDDQAKVIDGQAKAIEDQAKAIEALKRRLGPPSQEDGEPSAP